MMLRLTLHHLIAIAGNDGGVKRRNPPTTVGFPATCKNVVAVGASDNYRGSGKNLRDSQGNLLSVSESDFSNTGANPHEDMLWFSSFGETWDGRVRILPQIASPVRPDNCSQHM